jgi:hypothetical protein
MTINIDIAGLRLGQAVQLVDADPRGETDR